MTILSCSWCCLLTWRRRQFMVAISAPCRARLGRGAPRLELSALLWPASILLSSWPPNVYHHIVMSPSLSASERTVQDPDVGNASLYYGRVVRVRLCPNWPAKLNAKLNVFNLFCIACLREFAPLPKGRASQNPGSAAARRPPAQPPPAANGPRASRKFPNSCALPRAFFGGATVDATTASLFVLSRRSESSSYPPWPPRTRGAIHFLRCLPSQMFFLPILLYLSICWHGHPRASPRLLSLTLLFGGLRQRAFLTLRASRSAHPETMFRQVLGRTGVYQHIASVSFLSARGPHEVPHVPPRVTPDRFWESPMDPKMALQGVTFSSLERDTL